MLKPMSITKVDFELKPAAFGRLCVETIIGLLSWIAFCPAAFGRLCVETLWYKGAHKHPQSQPPSGGCVLKHILNHHSSTFLQNQPPSGGCVLKQTGFKVLQAAETQPPSGGCVLKQFR